MQMSLFGACVCVCVKIESYIIYDLYNIYWHTSCEFHASKARARSQTDRKLVFVYGDVLLVYHGN